MIPSFFSTRTTTIHLPSFPHEERANFFARRAQRIQDQSNADGLAYDLEDPLARRIETDEHIMNSMEDGMGTDVLVAGVSNSPFLTFSALADVMESGHLVGRYASDIARERAELGSLRHRIEEANRKKLVYAENAKHLPLAWAASTTVVARDESEFGNVVLRRSDSGLRSSYTQNLYVVGTYAAKDVIFSGDAEERRILEGHLNCLLGPQGQQLLVDYKRFVGPQQLFVQHLVIGVALGLALQIPAVIWALCAEAGSPGRDHANKMLIVTGTIGAVGALLATSYGLSLAIARRQDAAHLRGVQKVIDTHKELLALQLPAQSVPVQEKLHSAATFVGRHSYPVTTPDPTALPLVPLSYVAMDELEAYWRPAPASQETSGN